MPEVYNPQRTRGNAGKSGLRRIQKEKKPYWPGLDMDGHLIKMPSSDTDNTTNNNKDNDKMVLETHQSPSKISNKLVEDDPILSFDNDPPLLQMKGTRIHNNTTTAVSRPSSQKDHSPSHRTTQQRQQQQQQEEETVDSKMMSPLHNLHRKRTMSDLFSEETSTSSSSSSCSIFSNPEQYNKIAEIIATRGTRSGRQFHSPQQQQPMKRTKRQQQHLHTSGGIGMSLLQMEVPGIPDSMEERIQKNDSNASKRDPPKQMDELDFDDDEGEQKLDQQHQPQQTDNSKSDQRKVSFRNQIVQEIIPSLQNISPTGHRRRRKRKQSPSLDQSDITANSIMDGENWSMDESSSSFNATEFPKPSQNDKVDPTNDTVTGNVMPTSRTVKDNKNSSNMDGTVPVRNASGLAPSTDARQFAELAQSIMRNQLPIIGRAMEEIWSSLLKVVPEKSGDATVSSSSTTVLETSTRTTPHDTMNQERGDNELLVRMRTLCDQQDASVRRLEELRATLVEDTLRERDDWKKNHDQTVARLSSQLEASQENATLFKQQIVKTNGENQRLRQRLQETSDLVEELQTSRDETHYRRIEEHALQLKAKEGIISSQTAELKRLRDEIAILKSERKNNQQQRVHESTTEEKVSHDGSGGATVVVAAVEEERPEKGIISEPLLQKSKDDDDRSEQRCNPAVLLRKAGKPPSFRKNNNPVHRIHTGGNHLGTSRCRPSSSSSRMIDGHGTRLQASKISTLKVPVARHPPRFFVRIKTEVVKPSSDHYLSEDRDNEKSKPNSRCGPISIESPR